MVVVSSLFGVIIQFFLLENSPLAAIISNNSAAWYLRLVVASSKRFTSSGLRMTGSLRGSCTVLIMRIT
jgi:hypothetical protein